MSDPGVSTAAIWHDAENGAYSADLPFWEELAGEAGGTVLDLGCGTGRVALHLARRGHATIGLDLDPELVAVLAERAQGLPLRALVGDAQSFELEEEIALVLGPMQLAQLLAGSEERVECLGSIAAHLAPGGRVALAIVESLPGEPEGPPPLPDVREVDGWVYSSLPLDAVDIGEEIVIQRLRQTVSPAGELSEEENEIRIRTLAAAELEQEGIEAGLVPLDRRAIPPTDLHVGSTVVVLGKASWMELRVLSLYPEQMNIYADRGNIVFLQRRCEWRGIGFVHDGAGQGVPVDPTAHDLFYVGGGQDRDQRMVAADMVASKRADLAAAVESGAALLAVCGGYQLLGHSYQLDEEKLPGLGLVDLETVREPGPRLIGNVAIEVDLGPGPRLLAGFENHGGRTYLGPGVPPLGRVVEGHGNNGVDGLEGARRHNLIGTYLHGPLLPKNAWLADHLIATALERRYGRRPELEPLDDALEAAAEASARAAAGVS